MINYAQQLLDLYNAANPSLAHPATLDDVEIYNNPMQGGPSEQFNTTTYITAKEESIYFVGSTSIYYNRLPTGITSRIIDGDGVDDWQMDGHVVASINGMLDEKYANGEYFVLEDFEIERRAGENGSLIVSVRMNHIKYIPPETETGMWEFTILPLKVDLSGTQGELNGFK
ncbi:hypothetical protein pEaSNUABM29_00276 [Erwinia phage pEa_SNUABM_29]|nr:hypothetical protein pEaSNUABM29_00276 [Erwinia phage pEa_SNUABM_29]